jgi:hypothetical protein
MKARLVTAVALVALCTLAFPVAPLDATTCYGCQDTFTATNPASGSSSFSLTVGQHTATISLTFVKKGYSTNCNTEYSTPCAITECEVDYELTLAAWGVPNPIADYKIGIYDRGHALQGSQWSLAEIAAESRFVNRTLNTGCGSTGVSDHWYIQDDGQSGSNLVSAGPPRQCHFDGKVTVVCAACTNS